MEPTTTDVKPDVEAPSTPTTIGEFVDAKLAAEQPSPAPQSENPQDQPDADPEEIKPVPYERFKEVNSKFRAVEAELVQLRDRFASPEVQAAIDVVALIKNDPEKALRELEPIVTQLKQIRGDEIPNDLKEAVEEGTITPAYAKELSQLRLKSTATAKKLHETEESRRAETIASTLTTWDMERRKLDTDFQQGTPKWQYVLDMLQSRVATGTITSPEVALREVESIYANANKIFAPAKPVAQRTVLRSNSASKASQPDPGKLSLLDFVSAHLSK